MTARELAAKLGVSEAMVSYLLSDDRRPSLRVMLRIKDEFGWNVDEQATALEAGRYGELLAVWMRQPTEQPCDQ